MGRCPREAFPSSPGCDRWPHTWTGTESLRKKAERWVSDAVVDNVPVIYAVRAAYLSMFFL
jgi:hypothetical protein